MEHWQSKVIAITGTIGSGKSTVVSILREMGVFTVSADELAREVVEKGSRGLAEVVGEFGTEILKKDATLDRKKLGRIIFKDKSKRKRLEAILHPLIQERARNIFEGAINQNESLMVYEVPLLFEAALHQKGFKRIIVVSANDEVCLKRVMQRDNLSEEEARARLLSQWSIEEKKRLADIVIDNSGSIEELKERVRQAF